MYIYYPNYFPLKEIFRYSTSPTSFYISGNNAKKRKNVHEPHTSTCILWPNCINLTVSLQKISQQHSLVRVVCFVSSWFYSSCPPGDFSYLCSVFFTARLIYEASSGRASTPWLSFSRQTPGNSPSPCDPFPRTCNT